ncbi:MAG: DUF4012 domain-containing protein [Candidatus Dojkabacteria bacterium]
MIPEQYRLKNTIKYPTSLIIGGLSKLGLEIADSLIEQGGYVIIVDSYTEENLIKLNSFPQDALVSFLDFTTIPNLDEEIRRLDYVFYFAHDTGDTIAQVSTQDFLNFSNYFDSTLKLASKFDAKVLLTTSIKAHQRALASDDLGMNYSADASAKHKIYTNLELQRYAESLSIEYNERVNLDARIVRLAEIIGDGIDFNKDTPFIELIMAAARGENLKLKKDGLDTEFLVHVLDAAYGIIKAQFSPNTKGNIYSLSYENAFSHLSIAYKIQEVEENSQNIEFVDERDNLPTIKFYKPAPNLSQIGWTTRVPFEKAIKQSIAAAKIHLLEISTSTKVNGNKNFVDKLKSFVDLADKGQIDSSAIDNNAGPISRLIAERRRQEEDKKKQMEFAANTIRDKRRRKPRTFAERITNWSWEKVRNLGQTFSVFKNKTPAEAGLIIVSFALLIGFYLYIFSPAIVIAKELLLIVPEYQNLQTNVQNSRLDLVAGNADRIKGSLDNIDTVLDRFEIPARTLALGKNYTEVKKGISAFKLYAEGVSNMAYAAAPFYTYLSNFKNNTQLRAGSDSYLAVANNGADYSDYLKEMDQRSPFLSLGKDKIDKSAELAAKVDSTLFPGFIQGRFVQLAKGIEESQSWANSSESIENAADLLGFKSSKVYLFLLLDNTRLKPIGGDVSSFALVTVNKGSITDVVVNSASDFTPDLSAVSDSDFKEINNRKYTYKTAANLTLSDIGNISDFNEYQSVVKKVFASSFKKEIDGVSILNYSSLEEIIKSISNGKKFEVNNVDFAQGSFLTNLISVQDNNESLSAKYRLSTQLLAYTFNSLLTDAQVNLPVLLNTLNKQVEAKNVYVQAESLDYSGFIAENNLDGNKINTTSMYYKPGINVEDEKIVNLNKYPNISTDTQVSITNSSDLAYKVSMTFPNIGNSQEVSMCIPLSVSNSNISFEDFPIERVVINSSDIEKCAVFRVINESKVTMRWTLANGGNSAGDNISVILGQAKTKGALTTAYLTLSTDKSQSILQTSPSLDLSSNPVTFTQTLFDDQIIDLTIKR